MKTYIISEIGINYNGSLENCYKMIDISVDAGCHAAKFQLFKAKNMYPKSAGELDWKDSEKEYSYKIYDAVESFELPVEWLDQLIAYCDSKHIDFLASVFDIEGLHILLEKGIRAIKLSSYTITNLQLIEECAKSGLPIYMSTGGASLAETEEAVNTVLKYHSNLTILHCSIQYPTELKDVNMGVLTTLKNAFPTIKIGYSDHTMEPSEAPVQSIYLGGSVVEKHITMDKTMDGPDHFFALEPQELKLMVDDIKKAEKCYSNKEFTIDSEIYGSTSKICHSHEEYTRKFSYMTLFANKDIPKGEIIHPSDITILRPGKKRRGLDPKFIKLFKEHTISATADISFEDPITWENILK